MKKLRHFFEAELWETDLSEMMAMRRWIYNVLKILTSMVQDYLRHNLSQQASSLTYITLMSMVPVMALMFSLSKGLGAHEKVMALVQDKIQGLPTQATEFIQKIFTLVDTTNFSTLGTVGLVLLFWTVISVMGNIENAFNTVWRVRNPRTFMRKFSDYISVVVVVPVLFLATTSVNTMLSSANVQIKLAAYFGPLVWLVQSALGLFGILGICFAFTFLYAFMPNTRVRLFPALAGGIVAGVAWYLTQWAYLKFQILVTQYNAIYGTFAVIPFFLFWLYINWVIVLCGAIFSYAVQNRETLNRNMDPARLPYREREQLGMHILFEICQAHVAGREPWSPVAFSRQTRIAPPFVKAITLLLQRHKLIEEVIGKPGQSFYVPVRDCRKLFPADVTAAFAYDRPDQGPAAVFTPLPEHPLTRFSHDRIEGFLGTLRDQSFYDLVTAGTPADVAKPGV